MALTVEAAASASVNDYVAGYFDGSERGRSFVNAAGAPQNGITNSLPQIQSISAVTAYDGAFPSMGVNVTGGWKVQLKVSSLDTANASSTVILYLDQAGYFVKASTSNG